jgi:hypothetical protein
MVIKSVIVIAIAAICILAAAFAVLRYKNPIEEGSFRVHFSKDHSNSSVTTIWCKVCGRKWYYILEATNSSLWLRSNTILTYEYSISRDTGTLTLATSETFRHSRDQRTYISTVQSRITITDERCGERNIAFACFGRRCRAYQNIQRFYRRSQELGLKTLLPHLIWFYTTHAKRWRKTFYHDRSCAKFQNVQGCTVRYAVRETEFTFAFCIKRHQHSPQFIGVRSRGDDLHVAAYNLHRSKSHGASNFRERYILYVQT